MNRDIYQDITYRFIEQLKKGTVPWQKPWISCVQNVVSRKPYRGINAFTLGMTDRTSPFWLTFKQAFDLGGHVKKGEKSLPVIYYKILDKRDGAGNPVIREDGRPARIPFVRWANVFNLDQTEGIEAPRLESAQSLAQPQEKAAAIVENAKLCPIHHAGFSAVYSPKEDEIRLPAPTTFRSMEDYYQTLFHEMTHATGHESRLNRDGITQPIERSVRLAPGSSQLGSSILLNSSTGALGNGLQVSLNQLTRRTGFSYLTARFPRSNDRQDSTFPRESSGRVAFAIFPPFFRVSGTLQRPLACGSFSHRIRSQSQL